MLLKNEWLSKRKNKRRYQKTHRDKWEKNTTYQNISDTAKVVIEGKFITLQVSLKKTRKIPNKQQTLQLKKLEKEQVKPKVTRRKDIIFKMRKIKCNWNRKAVKKLI